jgi:hypothetical protein
MEKEKRTVELLDSEIRASRRSRDIEGVGIVFNKLSQDLGGFREIIKPEAIIGVLERSDVLALLNHNEERGLLARSTNMEGTLSLTPDKVGVRYSFEAPETGVGDEALSGVRRKDIRGSSFSFTAAEDGDTWEKQSDGTYLRTITKFNEIYDISLVYRAAYLDTSVAVRKLVDVKVSDAEKAKAEAKRIADLEEEQRAKPPSESTNAPIADPIAEPEDLIDYYKQLRNLIPKK